ncbi:hypothetical protein GGS26DRAFT_566977 [Hypomontagnella submonticulosa]|nr:hypothetical protein GGS26DRAFT_566977 [Hypomontagnella submonticulosa]
MFCSRGFHDSITPLSASSSPLFPFPIWPKIVLTPITASFHRATTSPTISLVSKPSVIDIETPSLLPTSRPPTTSLHPARRPTGSSSRIYKLGHSPACLFFLILLFSSPTFAIGEVAQELPLLLGTIAHRSPGLIVWGRIAQFLMSFFLFSSMSLLYVGSRRRGL